MDYRPILKSEVVASLDQQKLYAVEQAVAGLIKFIVTSLEQKGMEMLHEMTNPSLEELEEILTKLDDEAKKITEDTDYLQQAIHLALMMLKDIKDKNEDLCESGARILRTINVIK